ncbi:unnamed protein product [Meganyctiphanes norvegica]|uniref:Uncharacterized protein n=1 Tax=Meganyctiphanes norvegica TaxID=48144 RepID=A0AAV2RYC9_MEGNR
MHPLHIMNQIKNHMPLLHDKMHPPSKKLVEIQNMRAPAAPFIRVAIVLSGILYAPIIFLYECTLMYNTRQISKPRVGIESLKGIFYNAIECISIPASEDF